jgi:hypothetical protein
LASIYEKNVEKSICLIFTGNKMKYDGIITSGLKEFSAKAYSGMKRR